MGRKTKATSARRKLLVEMRMLAFGIPSTGYIERDPPVTDAFPGFEVPGVYKAVILGMDERAIEVPGLPETPNEDERNEYKLLVEDQVRRLFREAVGGKGPAVGQRWELLSPALWTGSEKPRWFPGLDAIAFELGTQRVTDTMEELPEKNVYRDLYRDDRVLAKFWFCFTLAE